MCHDNLSPENRSHILRFANWRVNIELLYAESEIVTCRDDLGARMRRRAMMRAS